MFPRALASLVTLAALLLTSRAGAQVRQPDGTVIPLPGDGVSLQQYLDRRMETGLMVQRDASVMPERFVPGCSIRFTVVARDSGYENRFGWYNVVPGRAPTMSELYELVGPTAPEGFTASVDFRSDMRYRGGEIGFYLHTPPGHVYYSERAYQPDRDVTGGFIHLLIYDSRATANAFYFAWEDLFGGGDNDFQDLLMIVDNLVCAGGGDPCNTAMPGACAAGIRQCRNGMLACVAVTGPTPERCNGVDDDCDGMTDEGDGLCAATEVCDRGRCVNRCMEELGCVAPNVCTDRGTCVEPACATVECPAGQVCVGGRCRPPCDGVSCPAGLVCRADRCVDPCVGVMCDRDQVCTGGVCQTRCPCRRCGAGESCFTDGRCRPMACAGVTCPDGFYCDAGRCRDACEGAVCPGRGRCLAGQCVAPDPVDAGVPVRDGGARDVVLPPVDAPREDVVSVADAGVRDAGVRDTGVSNEPYVINEDERGCGCRAAGSNARGRGALWLLALAAVARPRRRGAPSRRARLSSAR